MVKDVWMCDGGFVKQEVLPYASLPANKGEKVSGLSKAQLRSQLWDETLWAVTVPQEVVHAFHDLLIQC